ncbi:hypothetical protein [Muriicola sp. Z0-33]|uniref:hypothetical protein n=1 Tax=Muriicola sp. Z0-33 TaxID=2816957 RepID=UPI002236FE47|nr:hypothetical protein [Muriicola sp. Z0-33]MCW5515866.1 hypothetical protein [Muriicola sp. Z0-33]
MSTSRPAFTFMQILEGIEGVFVILLCYLTFFLKDLRSRWGMSKLEAAQSFPVDEIVPNPKSAFTHGVIIQAPASDVWPWIAQIGQGKGGFYSYEALENISGLNIYNSDRVLSEFQHPKVDDMVAFGPEQAYPIVYCEPGRGMAIENWLDLDINDTFDPKQSSPSNILHLTWLWYIEEIDEKSSRFISRNRVTYTSSAKTNFIFKVLLEPIVFAMDRKMCLGIKKRAERLTNSRIRLVA